MLAFLFELDPLILVSDLKSPVLDLNPLEYHAEAPRAHSATIAYVQVAKVLLQATPEGVHSCLDNQFQVVNYTAVSIRLLLQFHSDGQFSRNYTREVARELGTFHG